jgi:hypothetical protein
VVPQQPPARILLGNRKGFDGFDAGQPSQRLDVRAERRVVDAAALAIEAESGDAEAFCQQAKDVVAADGNAGIRRIRQRLR